MTMSHQKKSYNKNGYFIARKLFSGKEIDKVVKDIHEVLENQLKRYRIKPKGCKKNTDLLTDMQALLKQNTDVYLATVRLGSMLASLNKLTTHKRIERTVQGFGVEKPAFQTGPVFHILSDQLKIPGGYHGLGAHQDFTSTQASLSAVIVWIPLCDIDAGFYPLELIPGSHLNGTLEGKLEGHYFEIDKSKYNEKDFIKVSVKKGDVVFMSVFTIHRSCLKGRKGVRMSASIRYEDASEPTYIERGYPCRYKRTVDREILLEGFPSKQQLKKVFK